jgi:hypothetical protein
LVTINIALSEALAYHVYVKGTTTMSRMRMSKQLAQELKDRYGDGAHLYCVEKLSNGTDESQLWRDVLAWLDEGVEDVGEGEVASDKPQQGGEREDYQPSSS